MQEELGFPDKADKIAQPGSGWTPAELNRILHEHVVSGELTTFGCVEWQSQLFRGSMRARCYPFDMPKKRVTWVTCQLILQRGSKLTGMKATSVQLRLVGGARRIEPDSK